MSFRRAGGLQGMSEVRVHISVSADGYVAAPNQSLQNPLGKGGEGLHGWRSDCGPGASRTGWSAAR